MDGSTVQQFFANEVQSLISVYTNFESLVPSSNGVGASHRGEDGRFVETLIRELLAKYLPKELEVLTGFIIKPAVKCDSNKSRKGDSDDHSTQLDIIVYDTAHYPVYMRYGDTALVLPEGVICIISIKKTLHKDAISKELYALKNAVRLCNDTGLRPPYLALIGIDSDINSHNSGKWERLFQEMKTAYGYPDEIDGQLAFDETIGYIGAIKKWSIFKKRPRRNPDNPDYEAKYVGFIHDEKEMYHLPIQFLLTGILSVYYDKSRNALSRPGFTGFPSALRAVKNLGKITTHIPAFIAR